MHRPVPIWMRGEGWRLVRYTFLSVRESTTALRYSLKRERRYVRIGLIVLYALYMLYSPMHAFDARS